MTTAKSFEVRKDDLAKTRIAQSDLPSLKDGEILARVDRFALTANNITYGVVGEKIGYWKFFPAGDGWGVIPAWGFATVIDSRSTEIETGERLYGYFPMGTHLVMTPANIRPDRLIDGALHRAGLPTVYNAYARTGGEAHYDAGMDDERMLLWPLYATSFCLADFLADNDWFDASEVLVVSASSKTAIGLAMALRANASAPPAVGLTSRGNLEKVTALNLYSKVVSYDQIARLDKSTPAVIVDMSGNGKVLSELHAFLGDNMRFCSNVGVTHYEDNEMGPGFIRERSAMFFAPAHIQKRAKDWGPGEFEKRAFTFWRDAAIESRRWLTIETVRGIAAMEEPFHQLRRGRIAPDRGLVVIV